MLPTFFAGKLKLRRLLRRSRPLRLRRLQLSLPFHRLRLRLRKSLQHLLRPPVRLQPFVA
jgi:hypothetical protein